MRTHLFILAFLLLAGGFARELRAQKPGAVLNPGICDEAVLAWRARLPVPASCGIPEICDLTVTADPKSGSVTLSWSGGTPPFQVIRGDAPRFDQAAEIKFLANREPGRSFFDSGAYQPDHRYYYQVLDYYSAPEVYAGDHKDGPEDESVPHKEPPPPDANYCRGVLRRPVTWK